MLGVVVTLLALDCLRRSRHAARSALIQEVLGRPALDDAVGDRVGVALVGVARLADPALELDAAALLDDVRRLVRRGVQIGARPRRRGRRSRTPGVRGRTRRGLPCRGCAVVGRSGTGDHPAGPVRDRPVLSGAAVVFCNQRAEEQLGGDAVAWLLGLGVGRVILTRGPLGVRVVGAAERFDIRPPAGLPAAVDTTGAGDCLAGWFAGRMAAGDDLPSALAEAVTAASLSCVHPGAQPSYPHRSDVLSVGAAHTVKTGAV